MCSGDPRDRAVMIELTRAISQQTKVLTSLMMQAEKFLAMREREGVKTDPPQADLDTTVKKVNALLGALDINMMHTHPKSEDLPVLQEAHTALSKYRTRLYEQQQIRERRERAVHAATAILMFTAGVDQDTVIEEMCYSDVADIIEEHMP